MTEVKTYRVVGLAVFSPDKLRKIQKFVIDVRAVKKEDAIERVYSELGSRHKLKRSHIKILSVIEISSEESKSKLIRQLATLTRWVK
ncbi:MAG TPA: 50S ribosomal protein L18a [Acidilobales archaeon]|nr:50S ribosomal protein L18a [Acidilobales archaeon]